MTGLRTIVVGFGQTAQGLGRDERMAEHYAYATHAQVLDEHPAFEWLGVVDPSETARQAARDGWGIPHVAGELATVAREVKPEIAVIAIPPGPARAETVHQLPNLKAVMVEKPLGKGREGEAFVEFCRQRNVHVQVNYWRRGDDLFRRLAQGGLTDRIGRPQAVFATYCNGLYNNGGHVVDFIRMLLDEVATVQALGDPRPLEGAPIKGDVEATFALTLAGGAIVTMQPLNVHRYRELGLDIWGEHGRLALYQEGLGVFHYPLAEHRSLAEDNAMEIASDRPEILEPTVGRALYNLYDNLAAVVAGEAEPWSPGDQALQTEKILDAVLASAAGGGERLHFQ